MLYNIKYASHDSISVASEATILQCLKDHIDLLKINNVVKLYSLISNEITYVSDLTDYFIKYNIDFLKYVYKIPANCFERCNITQIDIPNHITIIGEKSFFGSNLKEITIPGSVNLICERAFEECNGLSSIKIEEGVEKIGDKAFYYLEDSPTVYLPNSVIEIHPYSFDFDAIIYCYEGSYAQEWCEQNDRSCKIIN